MDSRIETIFDRHRGEIFPRTFFGDAMEQFWCLFQFWLKVYDQQDVDDSKEIVKMLNHR